MGACLMGAVCSFLFALFASPQQRSLAFEAYLQSPHHKGQKGPLEGKGKNKTLVPFPAKETGEETNPKQTKGMTPANLEGKKMETTNNSYLYSFLVFPQKHQANVEGPPVIVPQGEAAKNACR